MTRYVMDCYYPDVTRPGSVTFDPVRMNALSDTEAVEEAKRIAT